MLVADALRAPPDRTREAIELAYLHDMTHDDIAHKTGVPLGTVKSDIRRACCEFATTWSPPMTDDATPRHRQ